MSEEASLAVLDALADGALHSGEVLAARFGISRAALAKRIDKLRAWGLEVQAQAGSGYQLAAPYERLDAALICSLLSKEFAATQAMNVAVLSSTDSTNTRLLASDAARDPQCLLTEYQSAGRGRRGRAWLAPMGASLMFSCAWSFAAWPARLTTLPLAVAVALSRVLARMGLDAVQIKWPNDLHIGGKKLAGILIEPRGEASAGCRVVIGVGLNWNLRAAQAAELSNPWLSLDAALRARGLELPGRNAFAAQLLAEVFNALRHFEAHGFAPFATEWRARDVLKGRPVRVEGGSVLEGIAQGIDSDGGLLIATTDGVQVVHAGDVSVRLES